MRLVTTIMMIIMMRINDQNDKCNHNLTYLTYLWCQDCRGCTHYEIDQTGERAEGRDTRRFQFTYLHQLTQAIYIILASIYPVLDGISTFMHIYALYIFVFWLCFVYLCILVYLTLSHNQFPALGDQGSEFAHGFRGTVRCWAPTATLFGCLRRPLQAVIIHDWITVSWVLG